MAWFWTTTKNALGSAAKWVGQRQLDGAECELLCSFSMAAFVSVGFDCALQED